MLRSSAFITAVFGFLVALGYHNQPIHIVQKTIPITFSNVQVEDKFIAFQQVRVQVFDNLTCRDCGPQLLANLEKLRELARENDRVQLELVFTPDINEEALSHSARTLTCVTEAERRWEYHTVLHENKNNLPVDTPEDQPGLTECLAGAQSQATVENNVRYASEMNITVYPTYQINQYRLTGNQPYENLEKIIQRLLTEQKSVFDLDNPATDLEKELENFRDAIN